MIHVVDFKLLTNKGKSFVIGIEALINGYCYRKIAFPHKFSAVVPVHFKRVVVRPSLGNSPPLGGAMVFIVVFV